MQKWSRKFDACLHCGETTRPHFFGGQCRRCYDRIRKGLPPVAEAKADTSDDVRGWRKCCRCKIEKPYGPGPNGEPSEYGVETRLLANGKPRGNGYRNICLTCHREYMREYIEPRREQNREANRENRKRKFLEKHGKHEPAAD